MEVMVPVAAEFHADSTSSTPYASAPTSPRRGGEWSGRYYTSAPASPSRAAAIFREFNAAMGSPRLASRSSVIPFEWEETPGTPKSQQTAAEEEDEDVDFAFDFSGQLDMGGSSPLTADELFEKGMIRPLKLPPRLQYVPPPPAVNGEKSPGISPRSPRSPRSPAMRFRRSPRRWGTQEDFDPFTAAIEETTRGRDRAGDDNTGRRSRRAARSLSPLRRVFDFNSKPAAAATGHAPATAVSTSAAAAAMRWMKGGGTMKWRLKDLLLFRSASEGRATGGAADKDPLRKYTALSPSSAAMLSRKGSAASAASTASIASISPSASAGEEVRNSSFRSTDGGGSVGGSSRRGASAHERHYAANRAAKEEMRRKTMLPYSQGLFSCLGFNPAINGVAKGFSAFRTRP